MKAYSARDVMTKPVVSARRNASVRDITLQLLSGCYSGLPVTDDDDSVIGIVTEFDLLGLIQQESKDATLTAEDIMTREVVTVDVDTPVKEVITILLDKSITRLPVTEKERLVGVISRCDLLRSSLDEKFTLF